MWLRLPVVVRGQTAVDVPHDLVRLNELLEEGQLRVSSHIIASVSNVLVALDVPVSQMSRTLGGRGNFLLAETPFLRQLGVSGKQVVARHGVSQSENGIDGSQLVSGVLRGLVLDNLDNPVIVGVTLKSLVTVTRDFSLPVTVGDWGLLVMRVQSQPGSHMLQPDLVTVLNRDKLDRKRSVVRLNQPVVVGVQVWVQGDLLLLGASRVEVLVRVQVSTSGVDMTHSNNGAVANWSSGGRHDVSAILRQTCCQICPL